MSRFFSPSTYFFCASLISLLCHFTCFIALPRCFGSLLRHIILLFHPITSSPSYMLHVASLSNVASLPCYFVLPHRLVASLPHVISLPHVASMLGCHCASSTSWTPHLLFRYLVALRFIASLPCSLCWWYFPLPSSFAKKSLEEQTFQQPKRR